MLLRSSGRDDKKRAITFRKGGDLDGRSTCAALHRESRKQRLSATGSRQEIRGSAVEKSAPSLPEVELMNWMWPSEKKDEKTDL
jgi:hypothetical protein